MVLRWTWLSACIYACAAPPQPASSIHERNPPSASASAVPSAHGSPLNLPSADAGVENSALPARALIVISVDGLRHDYLTQRDHAPALRKMRDEGAAATSFRSVFPTLTYPAHTTLVTGVRPARHGIVNNVVFDPFDKNEHGWYWYASDIRVPTLWDAARDAGIGVGNIYWPVTVGADIRFNVPQFWRAKNDEDDKLLAALSTPGLMRALTKDRAAPSEQRSDRERADAAIAMIHGMHPRLLFVYLTDLDSSEHEHGPMSSDALKTLRAIDGYVDEIKAAATAEYPTFTVALVSDHGFADVSKEVRPNAALRQKGYLSVSANKVQSYRAIAWKAGGTAAIMPRESTDEKTSLGVRTLFEGLAKDPKNGIERVYDSRATDAMGGFPGSIVVLEARHGYMFSDVADLPLVVPSKYRGVHGYGPDMEDMRATFFLWGDGIARGDLGEVDMVDVAPTLAALLGVSLPGAEGKVLTRALR